MSVLTDHITPKEYESPSLTLLGSVHKLTQQIPKEFGESDGYTFMGQGITNASP
jgi:hypothetical protein